MDREGAKRATETVCMFLAHGFPWICEYLNNPCRGHFTVKAQNHSPHPSNSTKISQTQMKGFLEACSLKPKVCKKLGQQTCLIFVSTVHAMILILLY